MQIGDRLRDARSETFRSLHVRNFQRFFVGQLISQIGNWLTLIAQTLLVIELGGTGVEVGVLVACQFAPVLLVGPWAGLAADRSDKRKLLLGVQSVAMAQSFVLAALAFSGEPPLWSLYLVAAIGGVTVAFDNPARRSFVVELVPEDHVNNAVSLNTALMTSSRVIGPALAGLLIVTVGYGWAFVTDGLSYIAVLIALWRIDTRALRPAPVTPKAAGQIRAGYRYIRSVPSLWLSLAVMALVGTLTFNFSVVLPLFVEESLDGSEGTFTIFFSVVSLGSLAGALASARRSTVRVPHVLWSTAAFGASMGALAVAPNLAVAFPIGIVVGLTSVAFLTSSTAIVQIDADPRMRGRVLALQSMLFLGSTPIGGPIVGVVVDVFSPRAGIALGAAAALVAAGGGAVVWRRVRLAEPRPVTIPPAGDSLGSLDAPEHVG